MNVRDDFDRPAPARTIPQPSPSLRVLIVEDSLDMPDVLVWELQRAGFQPTVELAQTPRDFSDRLRKHRYDLILSDFRMHQWTALDAARMLQSARVETPVIIVSGALTDEAIQELLRAGVKEFVAKDRLAFLSAAVHRALEESAQRERERRLRKALEEAEERYRSVMESALQGILIHQDSVIRFANSACARMFGYADPGELIGRDFWQTIPAPEAWPEIQSRNGPSHSWRALRRDRTAIYVESSATVVPWQNRPAVAEFFVNVTDRVEAEEKTRRLALFPMLNPNPVLEFNARGEVTYFNAAAQSMAQKLGASALTDMLPGNIASIVANCLSTQEDRMGLEMPVEGRIIRWCFFPIASHQIAHGYAADVTDQLSAENRLRHSQRMEAVGQLAAGVAHDYNNLLSVTRGYLDILLAEAQLPNDLCDFLKQISAATDRAINLTRQLLTFSRKEAAQLESVNLNQVINDLLKMLTRVLGEDITVRFNHAIDLPDMRADVRMIEQVVMNLAINARDAMPQGGNLSLSTTVRFIDDAYIKRNPEAVAGSYVCLSISDTGAGIAPEVLPRVFEPFFTTKETGKGTGLGLATTYGIVKQHQGWIEVDSQPGHGATFRIFFPAHFELSRAEMPHPADNSLPCGNETILLVEDEISVRKMTEAVLSRLGYQVLEAASGKEALEIWQQHPAPIDLLLTDMVMPDGMTGLHLSELLKPQQPRLNVIFMSGYTPEVLEKKLRAEPGIKYLSKPFTPQSLARAVRETLDGATSSTTARRTPVRHAPV
jgi:two-component system, cell cycle sensor histidine kinase and response regulator CckA